MVNTGALSTFQTVYEAPNTCPQENITAVVFLLNQCYLQKVLKVNEINESPRLGYLFMFSLEPEIGSRSDSFGSSEVPSHDLIYVLAR